MARASCCDITQAGERYYRCHELEQLPRPLGQSDAVFSVCPARRVSLDGYRSISNKNEEEGKEEADARAEGRYSRGTIILYGRGGTLCSMLFPSDFILRMLRTPLILAEYLIRGPLRLISMHQKVDWQINLPRRTVLMRRPSLLRLIECWKWERAREREHPPRLFWPTAIMRARPLAYSPRRKGRAQT